jgi:hypothetical protein
MLNNRAQATKELIIKNSEQGLLTTKKEIVENYPFDPVERKDGYVWNDSPKSHDTCSTVWQDVNDINFDNDTPEIIISHKGVYWVGTKEEVEGFIKAYFFAQCKPSLKRYWNMVRKLKLDNSIDVFTNEVVRVTMED